MGMTTLAHGAVSFSRMEVVQYRNPGPMIDGRSEPVWARLTHCHYILLAASPCHGNDAGKCPKRGRITSADRVVTFRKQRGEHDRPYAGK